MINTYALFKTIIAVTPFLCICLLLYSINLSKEERYRQFFMPFVAVAYSIIGVYCVNKIVLILIALFKIISNWIPFFGKINWTYYSVLLGNIILALIYCGLKSILLPVFSKIWDKKIGSKITEAGRFYKYSDNIHKWVLKDEWGHLKYMYTAFYYAAVGVSSIILVMFYTHRKLSCFQYPVYPVFAVLCLGEIIFFLSGLTEREHQISYGEDPDAEESMDFTGLCEKYRKIFGKRILNDYYEERFSDKKKSTDKIIEELISSHVNIEQAYGNYLKREKENGNELKEDYILSALYMLQEKSVLFANPFYKDLTPAIFFPLNISLLRNGKALILVGRHGIEEEIKEWAIKGFEDIIHVPSFWNVEILEESKKDWDIGILSYNDIYNQDILYANNESLKEVSFVIILEPSKMISNGQLAINMLCRRMEADDKNIIYCACDKNVDGLVDSLSHMLKTNITEVRATVPSALESTAVYWKADGEYMHHKLFKNIVKYLGGGTSIAAVALKHGIRDITWYSDKRFPALDIRWITGQYYEKICRYTGREITQESLQKDFKLSNNIWNVSIENEKCLIVEDEYFNLYEMGRQFVTRGYEKAFVNVIASNYMLRDYMSSNADIFRTDPKAIPQIAPDYARTRRNVVMQLIMMMINKTLSESIIKKELSYIEKNAVVTREHLESLIGEYYDLSEFSMVVAELPEKEEYNAAKHELVRYRQFTIKNTAFIQECADELSHAYYIAEDDVEKTHFLGGRLMGHVYQSFIIGQFHSLAGKYYEIVSIKNSSKENKPVVVVRRASDHITDRCYYRQLRTYKVNNWHDTELAGSEKTINGIKISNGYADLNVKTTGYLELKNFNDLKNAVHVDVANVPARSYRNKNILKIEFPMEEASSKICFQICNLLNESFRTTYPDDYDYITAITDTSSLSNVPEGLVFNLEGDSQNNVIYIIEDSQIDMGLLISVERNIKKYLELICDYCKWTKGKMSEVKVEPKPEPVTDKDIDDAVDTANPEDKNKENKNKKGIRGIIEKIKEALKKLFKKKDKKDEKDEKEENNSYKSMILKADVDGNGTTIDGEDDEVVKVTGPDDSDNSDNSGADDTDSDNGNDDTDSDVDSEAPEEVVSNDFDSYLKYGEEDFNENIDPDSVYKYLASLGFSDNPYSKTRERIKKVKEIEENYNPKEPGKHFCDFCGRDMTAIKYETLSDGRERCEYCSETAIKTVEEFRKIYKKVINDMEAYYGISINVPIKVSMVNSKKLAKVLKREFKPTPGYDARCVGVAIKSRSGYELLIENGAPLINAELTISHELTHIWQYTNWSDAVVSQYRKEFRTMLYEGMAEWSSIQYMILIGEEEYAKRTAINESLRKDEYGIGFNLYLKKYPLFWQQHITGDTPFKYPEKPL